MGYGVWGMGYGVWGYGLGVRVRAREEAVLHLGLAAQPQLPDPTALRPRLESRVCAAQHHVAL